jgi:hypothetical protein
MMDKAYTIRSEYMTWESDHRLHVDASTLCLIPGMGAPIVLEVVSHRTGGTGTYRLSGAARHEGDVIRWNYEPDPNCANARRTRGVVIWST